MKRLARSLALTLLLTGPAFAETRQAIVIGNSGYPGAPLANPRNDATLMARTLQELGFEVALYLDVTAAQVPLLTEAIDSKLASADVAVLYFAGHGLQYQGENLLLPVDTDLTSVKGVAASGTPLSELLESVTSGAKGIKIVVLDACRNPLVSADGALKTGFNFVEAPAGEVLIAFSTGAGEVAFDSSGGSNSPYTAALANALQQSGADIYDVFRSVRRAVRSGTGGQQIPWITGSIETDYVFRPGATRSLTQLAPPDPLAGQVVTAKGEVLSIDLVLWDYLQSSSDPRDFTRFAEVFPASPFAKEAQQRETVQLASIEGDTLSRNGVDLSPQAIAEDVAISTPEPEGSARTSLLLDQSGEYVMRNSFRTWPLQLPATEAGLGSLATDCDEEAADPVDPDKLSPGRSDAAINIRRAIRACAFDLATDPENPRLLFQFGRVLDVARRHEWANAFYDRAAALGYSAAMVNRGFNAKVGRGQDPDLPMSYALYVKAAALGNPRGRTNLGNAYLRGEGVKQDKTEAVLWLQLAASMGWPHAVNALGDVYRLGNGVEADQTEAVALYRSAAEQGQTTAMANVGVAYLNGAGVEKDTVLGLQWLDKAEKLGNGFAPVYSGRFYLKGDASVPADPARAKALFEAATRRGNAIGFAELAKGFDSGAFGQKDPEAAYRNALLAQAGRVKDAETLADTLGGALPLDRRTTIKSDVDLFLQQNGL